MVLVAIKTAIQLSSQYHEVRTEAVRGVPQAVRRYYHAAAVAIAAGQRDLKDRNGPRTVQTPAIFGAGVQAEEHLNGSRGSHISKFDSDDWSSRIAQVAHYIQASSRPTGFEDTVDRIVEQDRELCDDTTTRPFEAASVRDQRQRPQPIPGWSRSSLMSPSYDMERVLCRLLLDPEGWQGGPLRLAGLSMLRRMWWLCLGWLRSEQNANSGLEHLPWTLAQLCGTLAAS